MGEEEERRRLTVWDCGGGKVRFWGGGERVEGFMVLGLREGNREEREKKGGYGSVLVWVDLAMGVGMVLGGGNTVWSEEENGGSGAMAGREKIEEWGLMFLE
ncbi:uncharacterized protein G2W53_018365 [Senna tora]|uniref:Uncharacterized protein n=1 Tax=Senna tora TaxID=362788 RepID=A0A834TUX2_9FABA|nr:uncharacterized protein G2W53_018365 [Senna tora]